MSLMMSSYSSSDLLPFERRQPAQLQIENRLGLDLGERQTGPSSSATWLR